MLGGRQVGSGAMVCPLTDQAEAMPVKPFQGLQSCVIRCLLAQTSILDTACILPGARFIGWQASPADKVAGAASEEVGATPAAVSPSSLAAAASVRCFLQAGPGSCQLRAAICTRCTVRFGSTDKVLEKRMPIYYRIPSWNRSEQM